MVNLHIVASKALRNHKLYTDHHLRLRAQLILKSRTMDPSAISSNCETAGECSQRVEDLNGGTTPGHNRATLEHSRFSRNRQGWRQIVLNFTPSWLSRWELELSRSCCTVYHTIRFGCTGYRWWSFVSISSYPAYLQLCRF